VRRHCIVIVETEYLDEALWNSAGTDVTSATQAGLKFVKLGCSTLPHSHSIVPGGFEVTS
jgi:hypothetical protein